MHGFPAVITGFDAAICFAAFSWGVKSISVPLAPCRWA